MSRNSLVVLAAAAVVALPFLLRRQEQVSDWRVGDPRLVIVTPHNESIRYEFARGFAEWHRKRYGVPVRVEWRVVGGTTETMRYLAGEYTAAFRAWWRRQGKIWPRGGGSMMLDHKFDPRAFPRELADDPGAPARWRTKKEIHASFRAVDDPKAFTCKVDLFFGGGPYDHGKAAGQGLSVEPWAGGPPPAVVQDPCGAMLIPRALSGENWRSTHFYGTALSTFGICYSFDRLKDLGIRRAPERWDDLADPRYFRTLGMVDPTKSGSIAKAIEMIVQEQCHRSVVSAGFARDQVDALEQRLSSGAALDSVPASYHAAVAAGWRNGLHLVQLICANARYLTEASGRVPQDVASGNAAAGICIDFYGRYQAEIHKGAGGAPRMAYMTPSGGSSVSADPISLLRGAEHRELAVRFIEYVLSADGQKLWSYHVGAPGGPARYTLRRLPIRRDFYPSEHPELQARYEVHRQYCVDPLGDAAMNPYVLAGRFQYRPRWTARMFSLHRDLVRTMCLDAGDELRAAWETIVRRGGPSAQPAAMAALRRLPDRPEPLTWESALRIVGTHDRIDYMREWTLCFRRNYREARELAIRSAVEKDTREEPAISTWRRRSSAVANKR